MPQHFVLYPQLSVWENMNFAASLYGMSFFRGKELRHALEFVELYDDRYKLASQISGGMQRRLSLAATLVHKPELIFLDEPTAGIDPVLRRKFWDHFDQLEKEGRTIFITTQYVNEAGYCDLVGVMANGRLLMVDTPEGLRHRAYNGEVVNLVTSQPIDLRTEQELSSLPFVRGQVIKTGPQNMRINVQDAATAIPDILEWSRSHNVGIEAVEEYLPPFEDVFVELVKDEASNG
jgi:ABC-2 type transport system ATP-binding protein